jgi:NAD(P)-dependent dehydrogenase (short-subunit alcohol dehydrogenase family)/acyl carrier protein
LAEIEDLRFAPATEPELIKAARQSLGEWLYEIQWQPKAENTLSWPAEIDRVDPPGKWLILADRTGVGEALAKCLEEHGEHCRLVFAGEDFKKQGTGIWTVNPQDPETFGHIVNEMAIANEPPLRGVVHLWSLDAGFSEEMTEASLGRALVLGCQSALHLYQALCESDAEKHFRLWFVTRGAQAVGTNAASPDISQAPLWGLGKVIGLEHPEVWGGLLDMDPQNRSEEIAMLFRQVWDPKEEDNFAFRDAQPWVARLVRSKKQKAFPETNSIHPDGTYLITGGLGGLGMAVAHWMVDKGARNLVLVGRSGGSERARDAIKKLEEIGVRVVVQRCDVSCREDVDRIVDDVHRHMPALRGIVHAAGVIDDGLLVRQNWQRFVNVLAPKVHGAWNLHLATEHIPLDFFVLFSSAVSLFGSAGQGPYVTANAFLDALAHLRQSQGMPVLCINWGAWADVGAAARRDLDQRMTAQGVNLIAPYQGVQALEELLQLNVTQVSVLPMNWKQFYRYSSNTAGLPILKHIFELEGIDTAESLSTDQEKQTIRERLLAADEGEREKLLQSYLGGQVARILRIGDTRPGLDQPLSSLGFDSLMAVELRNCIEAEFGFAFALESLLSDATIGNMAVLMTHQLSNSDLQDANESGSGDTDADDAWEIIEL